MIVFESIESIGEHLRVLVRAPEPIQYLIASFVRKFFAHKQKSYSTDLDRTIMAAKARLRPDPTIGVSDLMKPLQTYMSDKGTRDVSKWLLPDPPLKWSQAPNISFLAEIHSLLIEYLKIAPNTVISIKKHREALKMLNCEQVSGKGTLKINFTSLPDTDFLDSIDEQLRICLHMTKVLFESPRRGRMLNFADSRKQRKNAERLLTYVKIVRDDNDNTRALPPSLWGWGSQAIEDVDTAGDEDEHGPACATGADKDASPNEKLDIFQKVLAKTYSSPEMPKKQGSKQQQQQQPWRN